MATDEIAAALPAGKVDRATGAVYPLADHLADAEAVARVMAQEHPLPRFLAAAWGAAEADARDLLVFLVGIHDIGKFSDIAGYQQKCEAWLRGDRPDERLHHTVAAQFLLTESGLLAELGAPDDPERLAEFLQVATGHHGTARDASEASDKWSLEQVFSPAAQAAAGATVRDCAGRNPGAARVLTTLPDGDQVAAWSWAIAGFVVLCDWLASNTEYFPLHAERNPFKQAERAVRETGVLGRDHEPCAVNALIGHESLRPLQTVAAEAGVAQPGALFLLEGETGSGKTEAGVILASRLLAAGATGVYWAMPTQATSNAIAKRMRAFSSRLWPGMREDELVLAHGGRKELLWGDRDDPEDASQPANAWMHDSLKKALLAPVAVGTVDQALLGILPTRHQCLRLLGLVGKVLVVDEVHAFDTYERELLKQLIAQHRGTGGSVVMLSATVPPSLRRELLDCDVQGDAYPQVAWGHAGGGSVPAPDVMRKPKRIVPITDPAELEVVVKAAVEAGGAVAVIRNTVGQAQESCQALVDAGVAARLLHSRFMGADRRAKEAELEADAAAPPARNGLCVVATQVLEQSLDLDFDVIVTDVAPADVLVQRMGRLHRHARRSDGTTAAGPDQRTEALIYVLLPEGEPTPLFFDQHCAYTTLIYEDPAVLWRTYDAMRTGKTLTELRDLTDFVAAAFDGQTAVPDCFDRAVVEAAYDAESRAQIASIRTLELSHGYWTFTDVDPSASATRLGAQQQAVVLVQNGRPARGHWKDSLVRVPQRVVRGLPEAVVAASEMALKRQQKHGGVRVIDIDTVGAAYTVATGWLD